MIKYIRKNVFINKIIRNSIINVRKYSLLFANKWRLSGIININFLNLNIKFYSECDDYLLEEIFYNYNLTDSSDLQAFLKLSKEKFIIFDIGANSGFYSILPASKHSNCTIYSFEPNPYNFNRLKKKH